TARGEIQRRRAVPSSRPQGNPARPAHGGVNTMTINEQDRQAQIAAEAEALTRTLAHSTREVPKPVVCDPPGLECRGGPDPGRAAPQNSGPKPSRPKSLTLSLSGHWVEWFPEGPASKGEIMAHQFGAEWWPELFEGLTKVQRRAVLSTLA